MATPFLKEGGVDTQTLQRHARWLMDKGTNALIVCGTTGEASTMSPAEQATAVTAVAQVAGNIPVIAGIGSNDTKKAVSAAKEAQSAGAVAALCVTPYYNKTTQAGLVRHFYAIADASPVPLILYNVPSRTGMNLTADTAETLSKHANIVGIKEASGNVHQAAEIVRRCGDALPLYSGNDEIALPILSIGGVGIISVAANIAPRAMATLCQAWFLGRTESACAEQLRLLPLIDALFQEVNPIPVKAALSRLGFGEDTPRLPLVPVSPICRERLYAEMDALGLSV